MGNETSADLGFLNQETRGGPQYFSLFVPNRPSYLRLGETPADEDATFKVEVRATLGLPGDTDNRVFDHILKDVVDDGAMDGNFIHAPVDALELHADTGWADHCEGHRLTTTGGDKVEVIKGSYKLITCGGQAGIDFSGGHMRTWSKTPGYISQVDADGHEATMTITAEKRYALRFYGGDYDEFWGGTSYRAYYGVDPTSAVVPAEPPPGGVPSIGARPSIPAMTRHHQEVHAETISAHLEGDKHTSLVRVKSHTARVVADNILERFESDGSVLQVARAGESAEISQFVGTNKIEESYTVGAGLLKMETSAGEIVQMTEVSACRTMAKVTALGVGDHWSGGYDLTTRTGVTATTVSTYGVNASFDNSVLKIEQIRARSWVECHSGMKYQVGKAVDIAKNDAASVKLGKLEIRKSKLTIFG